MVTRAVLLFVLLVGTNTQPSGKPPAWKCCKSKTVGGISYTLVGRMDTEDYNCFNDCIYQNKDEPGTNYCFAVGDLQAECESKPPMGGTKPPMGGSKPPMGGSKPPMGASKPPMGGSKPPMEGTKPPMEGSKPPMGGSKLPMGGSKPPMGGSSKPTAAPGSDDEVTTRVKGYIDTNTCNAVTYSDYSETECGDNAQSYYKEFIYNNKRVVVSNGMPDHPAENDPLQSNPNIRCPGWQFIQLPIDPAKGSSATDTSLGTIGLAITGGAFFNALSNPDGSLALPNEGASLDSCLGHSAPAGGPGGGGPPGGGGGPPGGGGGPPGGGGGPRPPPPGRRIK